MSTEILSFIASIVGSLAWPAVVLILLGVIFKNEIKERISNIEGIEFKYKNIIIKLVNKTLEKNEQILPTPKGLREVKPQLTGPPEKEVRKVWKRDIEPFLQSPEKIPHQYSEYFDNLSNTGSAIMNVGIAYSDVSSATNWISQTETLKQRAKDEGWSILRKDEDWTITGEIEE